MNLYFDIETIPSQRDDAITRAAQGVKMPASIKKPETARAWEEEKKPELVGEHYRRQALNGGWGEIIMIGYAFNNAPVTILQRRLDDPAESERELLRDFLADAVESRYIAPGRTESLVWIGHNILGFDLRFLLQRCVVNDVVPPVEIPAVRRAWESQVYDTMLEWACYQRDQLVSLGELCQILRVPVSDDDIDGSEVWDYISQGEYEPVAAHCIRDVERVRWIHRRLEFEE